MRFQNGGQPGAECALDDAGVNEPVNCCGGGPGRSRQCGGDTRILVESVLHSLEVMVRDEAGAPQIAPECLVGGVAGQDGDEPAPCLPAEAAADRGADAPEAMRDVAVGELLFQVLRACVKQVDGLDAFEGVVQAARGVSGS